MNGHPSPIDNREKTDFVFIVGVSRSGTSIMRRTLNSSDQVAICNENHYLGHFLASDGVRQKFRRKFGTLKNDENVYKLVDHLYSGGFANSVQYRGGYAHWRWITKVVKKENFAQRVLDSDRSERGLFVIMMQVFAEHHGKPIMGEKTPVHLRYVPTIMDWFPEAKIIHMLRDPRAIFVSELRRRKQTNTTPYRYLKRVNFLYKLYILLQTTFLWLEGIVRYNRYKKRYPNNYYLLKFEDLVTDPDTHIKQLCAFLGTDFQDKMLNQEVVSNGFQSGKTGFDTRAADRWKNHIDPWVNTWFKLWFGKYLKDFGYSD